MDSIVERMTQKLATLDPERIRITDESARHAGHAGAKGGGGHYILMIVSAKFAGRSALERHRLVYEALHDMMHKDIHALGVKAYTPEEFDLIPTH